MVKYQVYYKLNINQKINLKGNVENTGKFYGSWPGKNHDLIKWIHDKDFAMTEALERLILPHSSRKQIIRQ